MIQISTARRNKLASIIGPETVGTLKGATEESINQATKQKEEYANEPSAERKRKRERERGGAGGAAGRGRP